MKDLLHFDVMITPRLITVLYWILLLVAVVAGIVQMTAGVGGGFGGFLLGLLVMAGGGLVARIVCELVIVLFKINEYARAIAGAAESGPRPRIQE